MRREFPEGRRRQKSKSNRRKGVGWLISSESA